jgi:hypothetical protein
MSSDLEQKETLLKLTANILNALLEGLGLIDKETREMIKELCGKACAYDEFWGPAIKIAERIAVEEKDLENILMRANNEIAWCGKWVKKGDRIETTCQRCGCLLVQEGIVQHTGVFCLCSRGWVKTIFETLLSKPVRVELAKAIGFKDDECKYIVHLDDL